MGRKFGLFIALVAVSLSLATLATVYMLQKDEAQAIDVFAKTSKFVSNSSDSSDFNKIWLFNLADADKWTKKADMPIARALLSTSVVNGKIYAIGGRSGFRPADLGLSTVEEYDPKTDNWTKKANMPTGRWGPASSEVNGKIYTIGGLPGGVFLPGLNLSIVEEYDPVTNTWKRKANMPTGRWGLSTSEVNEKIYAIGGLKNVNVFLPTVEEYDPTTDTWTMKAGMPTERAYLSTSVVNGKIYAIGGFSKRGALSTVEEYDPAADRWEKKSNMPTARDGLSTSVVNDEIYAIGGMISGKTITTVEEYDPVTDTWTKKANMPTGRWTLATGVVDGKIYAVGGLMIDPATGAIRTLSIVEEYDPGLVDEGVEAKGKLVTSWGKIKSNHESLKKHE